ncbi:Putative transporter (MFS superfamily) [Oleispira antarctica RB-8]|uniref:Putative transporter (MFS superfamily) n=1 Tax=Oleispira antarctica RB-8 TaxID=698738 RepID=R4YUX8_OLEAN|nr:Putative transporter (MFS superfamily) [Oleispira antarctica RB-8]
MTQNVWILMLAQAFSMCAAPLVVFAGGLIGKQLASDNSFATLPVAAMVIGTALAVYPAAALASKKGRKVVFLGAMMLGLLASLLAVYALQIESFSTFVIAAMLVGMVLACIQQFRFAAMESVTADLMPVAASRLLLAGIIAAYLGPELVTIGQSLHEQTFTGAFYLLGGCFVVAFLLLLFGYHNIEIKHEEGELGQRSFSELLSSPGILLAMGSASVGFAVMSFIMTATPISMYELNHYSLEETKWVIQSHILAMFIPSFFSGWMVRKLGFISMMWAGLGIYIVCLGLAYWDQGLVHYWGALVLLGLGWNLLFVAGTALLPQMYQANEAHRVQGLNDLMVFSAQAIASLGSGVLLLLLGWQGIMWVALPMIAVQVFLLLNWQQNNHLQPAL